MVIDQAWKNRRVAEVDDLRTVRHGQSSTHLLDSVTFDQDDNILPRSGALPVDQTAAADSDSMRSGLCREHTVSGKQQQK